MRPPVVANIEPCSRGCLKGEGKGLGLIAHSDTRRGVDSFVLPSLLAIALVQIKENSWHFAVCCNREVPKGINA